MASEDHYVFRIFACGGKGGAYASDLTSFFIAHKDQPYNFISMDAGTGMDCIRKAKENGVFDEYLFNKGDADFKNVAKNVRPALNDVGWFKQRQLNGFLITHAHIDHTAGLVVGSADDKFGSKKPIIGEESVLDGVKATFKQPLWPPLIGGRMNFYETKPIAVNVDTFSDMTALGSNFLSESEAYKFTGSKIKLKAYKLSHDSSLDDSPSGKSWSTAFLVCDKTDTGVESACVLFFGDVGPDKLEWANWKNKVVFDFERKGKITDIHNPSYEDSLIKIGADTEATLAATIKERTKFKVKAGAKAENWREFTRDFKLVTGARSVAVADFHPLKDVWDDVAPLIQGGKLKTIFIETSYDNSRADGMLYGHLTPAKLQDELDYLQGKLTANAKVTVFAMHIKPTFKQGHNLNSPYRKIRKELDDVQDHFSAAEKKLSVNIIIPYQTDMIYVDTGKSTRIDRHGSFLSAKADLHPMQLHRTRSESDDDEENADVLNEQHGLGSHGYQEHAFENVYEHHGQGYGQGFGGYAPYQAMGYAPGYVVDAPPTSVVGSQSADLLPIFLALGALICCVTVVFGMFVCGWV
eukprot:CAMPEP_0202692516 /NCGR_PEP_ID=MMETSP1385-20130828/6873_1 /ASSEMBLY_ACC=CAM_ASM_000861 /TAXON_ID=933848 /ORGANISM="Elphidium margaritaceum" /LENGTH=579 /DNA_ID=CAMNT_0049348059 /DNA_START=85 /DNA_END=1821 /DNA_ORIENTATION=+